MYSCCITKKMLPYKKEFKEIIVGSTHCNKIRRYYQKEHYYCYHSNAWDNHCKAINRKEKEIPIKDRKDIDIRAEDICETLNITPSKKLGEIYLKIEEAIVLGKIKNVKRGCALPVNE